jgi:hypothetical protein
MVNRKEATPNPQSPKRDKIFSQSRDIREDRATRAKAGSKVRHVAVQ